MTASEVDYIGQTDVLAGQFEILSLPTEKNGLHYRRSRVQAKRLTVLRSRRNLKNGDVSAISMQCCNVVRLDMEQGSYSFSTMEPFGFKYIKSCLPTVSLRSKTPRVIEVICNEPIKVGYNGNNKTLKKVFDGAVFILEAETHLNK